MTTSSVDVWALLEMQRIPNDELSPRGLGIGNGAGVFEIAQMCIIMRACAIHWRNFGSEKYLLY